MAWYSCGGVKLVIRTKINIRAFIVHMTWLNVTALILSLHITELKHRIFCVFVYICILVWYPIITKGIEYLTPPNCCACQCKDLDFRYDFRIKRYSVRVYLHLFVGGLMFIYVICVCLRIVVSNTYCVVFLLSVSSAWVTYVASFSGLFILDCPIGIL
jgi:hypothetical protein